MQVIKKQFRVWSVFMGSASRYKYEDMVNLIQNNNTNYVGEIGDTS